jgi:hypothetical protein
MRISCVMKSGGCRSRYGEIAARRLDWKWKTRWRGSFGLLFLVTVLFRLLLVGLLVAALAAPLQAQDPTADMVIRAPFAGSEIVITTTARLAGAIHSLTWQGKEFIDSHDHGRQLQSASNFDLSTPITNETFNPTEAGSERDGTGPQSSSRLLHSIATANVLQTTTQMAFWLAPGGKSGPNPAKNTTILSNHLLTKRVSIGHRDMPNVIAYDVTFGLPVGERHTLAVFEALTGYMPPEFSRFLQFNAQSGELEPLDDTAGEIPRPIVFATPEGTHAMAIYAPPQKTPKITGPTFGRFRFVAEKVVKWNCVFRLRDGDRIAPGDYAFRMFVVVGELADVTASLRTLHAGAGVP